MATNKNINNNTKKRRAERDNNPKSNSKFKHCNAQKKVEKSKKNNRASRRASKFSNYQYLFRKNPSQLAHEILDEVQLSSDTFPAMVDIEQDFHKLFGECPNYSIRPPKTPSEISLLDYPVSLREIELNLRRLKQFAGGLDGITREHLRNVGLTDLYCLLNIVSGLCKCPDILRHNCTVLIPKKGDLTSTSNWRPITISSLFSRLLHKIIASRLYENAKLHHAQHGFVPGDGIMTNYTILDTVIKEHRLKSIPLFTTSIDLTKAFDKVHPEAIKHALLRKGIDSHTIKYRMSTYDNVIECHGQKRRPIKMCRGVRQGDTDSPILFNIVIDDLVRSINTTNGIKMGKTRIGCLLFADDIVLLSNTEFGMHEHLRTVQSFLKRTCIEINPSKCRELQLVRVPGTKHISTHTKPLFKVEGKLIPALKVQEQFKYLGHNYSQYGMTAPSAANLENMLERIRRAPLKPWQELFILNRFLIPRIIHCSQSTSITVGKLTFMDRLIKRFIKATLHLPKTTPTAYLYARVRDGGLSIPCLRHLIGVVYR